MNKELKLASAFMAAIAFVSVPSFAAEPAAKNATQRAADRSGKPSPNDAGAAAATVDESSTGEVTADTSIDPAGSDPTGADAGAGSDTGAARPAAAREGQPGKAGKTAARATAGRQQGQQNMDQKFVEHAASGGMFEVAASQLALKQASSDELKQMAQRMIEDHTQANQQLMQIAQSKKIQVPKQMKPVHQAMLQELSQMQGQEFDRAFLYGNVASHVKSVLKFRDASQELQDEDLKQFASQTLPTLREHLTMAQQMAGMGDATTAGSSEAGSTDHADHGTGAKSGSKTGASSPPAGGDRQRPGARSGQQSAPGSDAGTDSLTNEDNDTGSGAGASGTSGGATGGTRRAK